MVESIEDEALVPFRAAIEAGIQAIMTAHIVVRELGDAPATMSREILHGLLREELGYDGLVMTDALEMRAIADTVGVEEGAVRAIEAGADALCLGHDLFDDSVSRVRDALVEAVRSGRLQETRLVDAAGRVRRAVEWASQNGGPGDGVSRDVGMAAARRALQVAGVGSLSRPPLVVELEPSRAWRPGACRRVPATGFARVVPESEVVRLQESSAGERARAHRRPPARDPRPRRPPPRLGARAPWKSSSPGPRTQSSWSSVCAYWRPTAAEAYLVTNGAGRVNVEAAAERLYASTPSR